MLDEPQDYGLKELYSEYLIHFLIISQNDLWKIAKKSVLISDFDIDFLETRGKIIGSRHSYTLSGKSGKLSK